MSSFGIYGSEIGKYGLLTQEMEREVCINASNGDIKSRNELITSNLRLVIKIALRYKGMGVELNELIAEGNKGLVTASMKFDPSFDNKFSTYAYFWIRQAIISCIESTNQWGCLSNDNVYNQVNCDGEYVEKELIVDMNEFDNEYDVKDIINRIDRLPIRDSKIVKHYFGINGFSELNTIELSEKFKISTMRVSNIIENSIRKIRCNILENIK